MTTFNADQLGRLLFKLRRQEPRRNLKRWLKDCGGEGSAEELDRVLAAAQADPAARRVADQLEAAHLATLERVRREDLDSAPLIAQLVRARQAQGVSQAELAGRLGLHQPQIADYERGEREPGAAVLVRLAAALGKKWVLAEA